MILGVYYSEEGKNYFMRAVVERIVSNEKYVKTSSRLFDKQTLDIYLTFKSQTDLEPKIFSIQKHKDDALSNARPVKIISGLDIPTSNIFVNLSWLEPVTDFTFDRLPNGVFDFAGKTDELNISIQAISTKPLDQSAFKLFVNNEQLKGNKMSVSVINKKTINSVFNYNFKCSLHLTKGKNAIKLTYGDISTQELVVNYYPMDINLYVMSIGTSSDLKYSQKDARDFVKLFANQSGKHMLYRNVYIDTLIGEKATGDGISRKLNDFCHKEYGENDVFLIYFSSHGMVDDNGKFRLLGSDFESEREEKTSINFEKEIQIPLAALKCKTFIFLDACKSGGAIGNKASDYEINSAIRNLINSNYDISIISSSKASESSWEDDLWENGAFTKAIKEALSEGKGGNSSIIKIGQLYNYLNNRVPKLVNLAKNKTGEISATQNPVWNRKLDLEFYVIENR